MTFTPQCYLLHINGQVQGVGFRPFIYRLAQQFGLAGWVRNDGHGVEIVIQGETTQLDAFVAALPQQLPPHAAIHEFSVREQPWQAGLAGFVIAATVSDYAETLITPDSAICADCLSELFDPENRRYRHAFINCMHCGPRYTLVKALPYDRAQTSMAVFDMCATCLNEYQDPHARRFHAQPNACPACGPTLQFYDVWGTIATDPIQAAADAIRAGKVIAVKGLGGFHLVCDAQHSVVASLRQNKLRADKPFALMVLNAASAELWASCTPAESELLTSSQRPILLLDKLPSCDLAMPDIAPGLAEIGLFLPYTPVQYLLFYELLGRPAGQAWLTQAHDLTLVMTSANLAGDALVINDQELAPLLGTLVDGVLSHNREIVQRCDDSVRRSQQFVRRARGYVPMPIKLAYDCAPVLACGAGLKNTLCLTRHQQALLSQHIGDLDQASTREMLHHTATHLISLLQVQPKLVVCDQHPDYYSSQFAASFAAQHELPLLQVQHHHAHIAAVCAEHQLHEPVLGLALDGIGLGPDKQLWGGELLMVDGLNFTHLGGLAPLPLPGGDKAAKQSWRMAAAALFRAGRGHELSSRFASQAGVETIQMMLQRGINCPPTSSMGRVFDAAAALLGICLQQSFEGQAAMLLEAHAHQYGWVAPLNNGFILHANGQLDLQPLLNELADCTHAAYGAALFHSTLVAALGDCLLQASAATGLQKIVLNGGCFLNRILLTQLTQSLLNHHLSIYSAHQVPPNDGGIALGQVWLGQLMVKVA